MNFFPPDTMDTSEHGTKNEPNGTFEICQSKTFFSKNQL
jgi:hypothetical protein